MGETKQISVLQADGPWKIILKGVNKSLPRTMDQGEAPICEFVKDTEVQHLENNPRLAGPELAYHPENGQHQILAK